MLIDTHIDPRFALVVEEFERNFLSRDELGAAFSVVLDGELVVDLWGGIADSTTGRPWTSDTLQLIFSGTKALTATCLLMLVDRLMLELDDPVCRHWPEFAAAGKEGIRVIDVLSHRSGLPAFASPVTVNDILDGPRLATLLAAQAPFEDPRASETYQPITFGSLCAEILRRIDGRTVGTFFAEEIAQPLELELWIGLPDDLEPRVSTIELASDWAARQPTETELAADALLAHTRSNPPLDGTPLAWNMRQWHAAEIPGVNAIGTARSIARFYGCLASGGELDGVRILSDQTLRIARRAVVDRIDPLSRTPTAFGAGFGLQTDWRPFGPPGDAFGHSGLGGSIHGAWPSCRLGFSYAMNRLLAPPTVDARSTALLFALHKSLLETA